MILSEVCSFYTIRLHCLAINCLDNKNTSLIFLVNLPIRLFFVRQIVT